MIDAVAFKGKLLQHAVAANVSTHTKNELKSTGANNLNNSSCMQIENLFSPQSLPTKKIKKKNCEADTHNGFYISFRFIDS
jgi:hypothetical protein